MCDCVKILGARGSIPVTGGQFSRFGGATTCVLVRLDGQYILLDAGTGLLNLPEDALAQPHLPLLLSHPHADHLIGLGMCPYLFRPGGTLTFYAKTRDGLDARGQVHRLYAPPLWPTTPENLPAEVRYAELPEDFFLGPVHVETMEGAHPGGVTLFRMTGKTHRVAFLTDCTLTDSLCARLLPFVRGCDLLLVEGQYSDEEWAARSTFGHSSWRSAARFAAEAGAKQVRVIHHDPCHTDEDLLAASGELRELHPCCSFGYEGEEVFL